MGCGMCGRRVSEIVVEFPNSRDIGSCYCDNFIEKFREGSILR